MTYSTQACGPVRIVECSTVEEVIEACRRIRLGPTCHPFDWAFRGQADARWHLVPTALRQGTKLGFYSHRRRYISKGDGGCLHQMCGEAVAARQFVEVADRVGLPLPDLDPFFRQDGFDLSDCGVAAVAGQLGTAEWPKPEMLELLAIAQHHGVPTRLLDFTFDPRIAIFFAAEDVVSNAETHSSNEVTELAVWGAHVRRLQGKPMEFRVVEVESAKNPFLHAQRGLFVIDLRLADGVRDTPSLSLDERICGCFQKPAEDSVLFKVTLPVTQAREALRVLALEGIDRPHLMPTLDNVVAFLRQQS